MAPPLEARCRSPNLQRTTYTHLHSQRHNVQLTGQGGGRAQGDGWRRRARPLLRHDHRGHQRRFGWHLGEAGLGLNLYLGPRKRRVVHPGSVVSWLGFALETYIGFTLGRETDTSRNKYERRQFPLYPGVVTRGIGPKNAGTPANALFGHHHPATHAQRRTQVVPQSVHPPLRARARPPGPTHTACAPTPTHPTCAVP